MVILLNLWYSLKGAMFSLYQHLIGFWTTFLLLVTRIPRNHSRTVPQSIMYWNLKAIKIETFKAEIKNSVLTRYPDTNITELAQQYDGVLHVLIDLHSLLVTKKISLAC